MTTLIEGTRVRLVAAEPEMAEQFRAWLNNTDTRHLIGGTAYPISAAGEEAFIRGRAKVSWEDGVFLAIEAIDGAQPILIGSVELRKFSAEARSCDVGILVGDPAYRGAGYGTEAMRLACRFAFEEMGLERIELGTYEFNTRAMKSYEKLGFVVEGRRRRAAYIGGRYYDTIEMGLLRDEYLESGSSDG